MKTSSNNSSLTTISGNSLKIPNDINQTRSSIKHLALAAAAAMLANAAHLRRAACLAALVLGLGGFVPTAHADYASTALGYSPVGYWRLNETTPSADPAISYNTGTGGAALNGAYVNYPTRAISPGALAGSSNTAVSFNGTNQNTDIPYAAQLNTTVFSAEIWAKPANTNANQALFSSGQPAAGNRTGWVVYQLNGSNYSFRPFKNSSNLTVTGATTGIGDTVTAVTVGSWQHIVVVNDGTNCILYVNGAAIASAASASYAAAASGGTTIGKRFGSVNNFNGTLDEAAFYNTALSPADVLAHYNNGLNAGRATPYETLVGTSSPVAYYRMDEPVFVPPTAANIGTLGANAQGAYSIGTNTNVAGPPSMPGLGVGNVACGFDGTGKVDCGSDPGLDLTAITVSAWIKANTQMILSNMSVVAKGSSQWSLQLDGSSNHLKWACPGPVYITGTKNVTDGLWHHVVAVAGASGMALYVDGDLDASDPTPVTLTTSADPVTIGSRNTAGTCWNGSLDEVAIFPAELNASQVSALYLANTPPTKDIYSFGPGAVISGTNITWTLPLGTNVTNLAPVFTNSFQSTCDKVSGDPQNFTNPVTYSITGLGDPIPKVYTVTVVLANVPVLNGMLCWYDAGVGITTDGTGVLTWNDQSGNGHHATRLSGAPTLVANDINAKNGVHFRSNTGILNCAGGMFVKEQYVVVRSPNPNWSGGLSFLGRKSGDFLTVRESSYNMAGGTTGFWQDHFPVTVVKNGHTPAPYPSVVNSNQNQDKNGASQNGCKFAIDDITQYMILKIVVDNDATTARLAQYPYCQIGQNETLNSGEFDVAEIIGYASTLSSGDEQVVGAYLTNKYGLTTTYAPYVGWAATNAGGQAANLDYNNDRVQNGIAYFMGVTGLATLPGVVGNTMTWTNGGNIPSSAYGTQFVVQTSTDLITWIDVPNDNSDPGLTNTNGSVSYTLPAGQDKFFCRLKVTPQ